MLKKIFLFVSVILTVSLFTACESKKETEPRAYADYVNTGKRIAVQAGDIYGDIARDVLKAKEAPEFSSVADMLESLRMGKVDAVLLSGSYVNQLKASGAYPDVDYLKVPEDVYVNKAAPIFHTAKLRDQYNEWFKGIAADGTWQEIVDRWLSGSLPSQEDIPQFELTGENGTLKMCDTGNYPPLIYFDANGKPAGFDVEMMSRFALHMGMKLEIEMMNYDAIVPYVISGKADMSACTVTVTEEREEGVIFGEPSVITPAVLIVPKSKGVNDTLVYTDFIGKSFAVKNGTIYDSIATDLMKASEKLLYEDYPSTYEAVQKGRVDAAMRNYCTARVSLLDSAYPDLAIIALPENVRNNPIGAISMKQKVIDDFNEFLTAIKASGIYDEMRTRWIDTFDPANIPTMPEIPLDGKNGTLVVAVSSDYMPFSFLGDNGSKLGFDMEMAKRFAAYLKKDIEFVDMAFSGLLHYVISGKADIAISDITITEERKQSVLFTEPYFIDLSAVIYKRNATASVEKADGGFIEWLQAGIERNMIANNRWKMVTSGLGITMIISIFSQLFGTALGCFACWLLMSKIKIVRWLGDMYCGLIYGTPVVVLLMITYYIIFGNANVSNVLVAIAAFAMVVGAGVAQNLKGAIDTVDPVEIEAARSMGFSAFRAFRTITLPQAIRRALPFYTNGFVELVKSTAIVGYIAIQDLTRAGDIIRSSTYDAYFPLIIVAVIYLVITLACTQIFKFIVRKINGGVSL